MPVKLTPEVRLQRARAAFDDFRVIISQIDHLEGQARGRAYRSANSKIIVINRAVARIASVRFVAGATDAQKWEARRLLGGAENLYSVAWKRHHK